MCPSNGQIPPFGGVRQSYSPTHKKSTTSAAQLRPQLPGSTLESTLTGLTFGLGGESVVSFDAILAKSVPGTGAKIRAARRTGKEQSPGRTLPTNRDPFVRGGSCRKGLDKCGTGMKRCSSHGGRPGELPGELILRVVVPPRNQYFPFNGRFHLTPSWREFGWR